MASANFKFTVCAMIKETSLQELGCLVAEEEEGGQSEDNK